MGRKSQYNFQEIEKLKSYGFSWDEIAERLGYKAANTERAYYRYKQRMNSDTITDTKTDTTDTISIKETIPEIVKRTIPDVVESLTKQSKAEDIESSGRYKTVESTDCLRAAYFLITGKAARMKPDAIKTAIIDYLSEEK